MPSPGSCTSSWRRADVDAKADLHRYLQAGRDALLSKLDGLGERDVRRPLTPTATASSCT